ncbi:MAG: hypothetical protein OEZ06_12225 [Myxococcales bacterium]|nr:hypothetical protein [Myxococcales bacterium]
MTTRSPLPPAEAVLKFLRSVGNSSEAEFYLDLFRSWAPERFAAIAVLAAAMDHGSEGVALDLRFLHQLGLTPLVVLGLYDPARSDEHGRRLVELSQQAGIATEVLEGDASAARIAACASRGQIPILSLRGDDHSARLGQLAERLAALSTHKLILLRPQGGIRRAGERLSVVNLSTQYEALHQAAALDAGDLALLEDSRRLIFELLPAAPMISLTSPLNLMRELFTVKGAGTLLRRGAVVERHRGYDGVDTGRLRVLLEASFGRPLRADFFERPVQHVYLERDYRGAALVADTEHGAYLDKFAVTRQAQGEGIGQDLWSALTGDHPALLWRARSDNPIRSWYERHCQGRYDAGAWTVFVRGIDSDRMGSAVRYALSRPEDFAPAASSPAARAPDPAAPNRRSEST